MTKTKVLGGAFLVLLLLGAFTGHGTAVLGLGVLALIAWALLRGAVGVARIRLHADPAYQQAWLYGHMRARARREAEEAREANRRRQAQAWRDRQEELRQAELRRPEYDQWQQLQADRARRAAAG